MPFWPQKISSRSSRLECSYGKIFILVTEISVAKTEISVTGSVRLLKWTHRSFYEENKLRSEISETQPARVSGLIWRGRQSLLSDSRITESAYHSLVSPSNIWRGLFISSYWTTVERKTSYYLILRRASNLVFCLSWGTKFGCEIPCNSELKMFYDHKS